MFPDNGVGMGEEVVANCDAWIKDNMGEDSSVITDMNPRSDHCVGTDVGAFANPRRRIDDSRGMDARCISWRLIEKAECLGEREVRICQTKGGYGNIGKFRVYKNRRGTSFMRQRCVPGIGNKGDIGWTGLLDTPNTGNFNVAVTA
jgi:hypothetical protein